MVNQLLCSWNYNSINFNNTNMKEFGQLLKDLFYPKEQAFWIRIKTEFDTIEERDNFIYATIELLEHKIKIK